MRTGAASAVGAKLRRGSRRETS